MRILVTGARGKAGAVTVARLRWDEHEVPGAEPDASSCSYVVVDSLADLFAPGESRADAARHDSRSPHPVGSAGCGPAETHPCSPADGGVCATA